MTDSDYKVTHYHESEGDLGSLGLRILTATPGKTLSEEAVSKIRQMSYQMMKEIEMDICLHDPMRIEARKEWVQSLLDCFPAGAGIYHEETPNGYCSQACCIHKPWLVVTTAKGRITIGPRKRVMQISWDGSDIKQTAHILFPNEDVTKEGRLIHAWGMEKAKEYIAKLLSMEQA